MRFNKRLPNKNDIRQLKKAGSIILVFVILFFIAHDKNISWHSNNGIIIWSGAYFKAIDYSKVATIILDDPPGLSRKSNGYAAFGKKKGYFIRRKDKEKVLLFIKRPEQKCIHFLERDGSEVYLNFDNKNKTLKVFNVLKNLNK